MNERFSFVLLCASVALFACGSDSGDVGTDPGDGSRTLLVEADVAHDGGAAKLSVRVRRAGADVTDAIVMADGEFGEVALAHVGNGEYRAVQAGWASWYGIRVEAGQDWLEGAIESPEPALLRSPEGAFDPHAGPVVTLAWSGELAHRVRVRSKDFEWEGPDEGRLDVPSTIFVEPSQELEIRRENFTPLAGGAPGSSLSSRIESKTDLIVVNPFEG